MKKIQKITISEKLFYGFEFAGKEIFKKSNIFATNKNHKKYLSRKIKLILVIGADKIRVYLFIYDNIDDDWKDRKYRAGQRQRARSSILVYTL